MIGFIPSNSTRRPIYGIHKLGKVGYVETAQGATYFQNAEGHRIAKVMRYKEDQKPFAQSGACGGTIVPFGLGE